MTGNEPDQSREDHPTAWETGHGHGSHGFFWGVGDGDQPITRVIQGG